MTIPQRRNAPLYGWPAPLNISTYGLLAAFGVGSAAALVLATGLTTLVWGPPEHPVLLLPAGLTRPLAVAGIPVAVLLTRKPRHRTAAVAAVAALTVLALTAAYSPLHFVETLARALKPGRTVRLVVAMMCLGVSGAMVALVARGMLTRRRLTKGNVPGSTTWGRAEALRATTNGFILGQLHGQTLRYAGSGHLMTVAATRTGKGVGAIIPNLLSHTGSVVVTDPKGENYFVTGRYRREVLQHNVVVLDPFKLTSASPASYNPLDLVDLDSEDYVESAMVMADMIIPPRSHVGDSHWALEGRALLYAFILHVCTFEDRSRRNLFEVRRLLTLRPRDLKSELEVMLDSDIGQVAEGAGRVLQKSARERGGVFSTAQSYTHFLTSPRMQRVLGETDFTLDDLVTDRLGVYLVLPREHLTTFAPWLRLMISCSYHACTHDLLRRTRGSERILFLLDEFANLGYMANIKEAVSLGGGYGVSMWLILQDLAQLRREYHYEWESFLANSDVIQTFGVQDPFTAEHVTKLLGQTTVWQRRLRKSSRREGHALVSEYNEDGRPLLRPEELRRLHPDRQLLLVRPYQPVVADKVRYYREALFAGRFDRNPYVNG